LADDKTMANFSADEGWDAMLMEAGKFFTLEHPGNSLALHLASWQKLMRDPRVDVIRYHTCRFEGSRRKKSQVLITDNQWESFQKVDRARADLLEE